jgi:hypothetical protein
MSDRMTTYRRADGEMIGDFAWVNDREFFDEEDEPIDLIEEHWVKVKEIKLRKYPRHYLCEECGGEGCDQCEDGESLDADRWVGFWTQEELDRAKALGKELGKVFQFPDVGS